MPNIDYTSMNAQMSALGATRGKAMGKLQLHKEKQERKVRMEQRYAQLAQDKARHNNELAKTEYAQVRAAKIAEDKEWGEAEKNGTIRADGRYTEKHWKQKAFDRYANSGVKRTTEDINEFYRNESYWMKEEMSGSKQGMTRQYQGGDVAGNLKRKFEYNAQVEAQEGGREFFEGPEGAMANGLSRLFGDSKTIAGPEQVGFDKATEFDTFAVDNQDETLQGPVAAASFDPKSAMKVYGKNEDGSVDTSTIHTLFVNKGPDGALYEATGEGAVPWDGDYVDAAEYNKKSSTTNKRMLTAEQQKHDISPELRDSYSNANKVIRLTKSIVGLSGVPTSALTSTIPAQMKSFFGTEIEGVIGDEKSQKDFMRSKIDAIVRSDKEVHPDTATAVSANLGALDSQKLFLAYAMVRIQRGSGRFTGQELNTTLEAFKSNNLAYSLAAVNHAYNEAQMGVKKNVKAMAAEATVSHLFGSGDERTKSQLLATFNTDPIQDDDGSWSVLVRKEDRELLGFRFIEVSPDGGVDYMQ